MPGDIVTVFSKNDVAAPAGRRPVVVSLEGEFNFAGVYQAQPKETLRQLVIATGGLTKGAYVFGAQFLRESTRREQEERLKSASTVSSRRAARGSHPGAKCGYCRGRGHAQAGSGSTAGADRPPASVRPTGRIVLELPENATVAHLPDIELEDGDRLVMPQVPSQVSVFGTVFNESSFLYTAEQTVGEYLTSPAARARRQTSPASSYCALTARS